MVRGWLDVACEALTECKWPVCSRLSVHCEVPVDRVCSNVGVGAVQVLLRWSVRAPVAKCAWGDGVGVRSESGVRAAPSLTTVRVLDGGDNVRLLVPWRRKSSARRPASERWLVVCFGLCAATRRILEHSRSRP